MPHALLILFSMGLKYLTSLQYMSLLKYCQSVTARAFTNMAQLTGIFWRILVLKCPYFLFILYQLQDTMENAKYFSTVHTAEYFSPLFSAASKSLLRSWGGFAPDFLLSCQLVGNFAEITQSCTETLMASSREDSALDSNASGLFVPRRRSQ